MTIAELHGKLSPTGSNADERLEDLLTSDVFGALRYLPPDKGIMPFLNVVLCMNGVSLTLQCSSRELSPSQVSYYFWPRGITLRRVPDLLVLLDSNEEQYAFVFEAKYLSGPSDLESSEELDAGEAGDSKKTTVAYGLQLADQYDDLVQPSPYKDISVGAPIENRFLVYITGHATCRQETLEKSLEQLRGRHEGKTFALSPEFTACHILWTSWFDVWRVIDEQEFKAFPFDLVARDLLRLLKRKGFKAFSGFADIANEPGFDLSATAAFWNEVWFHWEDDAPDLGFLDVREKSGGFWRGKMISRA